MGELLRRMWYLLNRRRFEREMAEEMAYHRQQMEADGRQGFGSELRLIEDTREVWGWAWLDRFAQDLRYGARILRKAPGFTVTAVLVLGLGIGVPLTAFRQMLADLQAGAAPDPDTMVQLTRRAPGLHITVLSYPALAFYRANARSFRAVIGISPASQAAFAAAGAPAGSEPVNVRFVTVNYFREFGIVPTLGKLLAAGDEQLNTEPAALLSEPFWRRRLGGERAAIGRTVRLNGKAVRVVGVIPAAANMATDVWMPMSRQPFVIEGSTLLTDWNSALDAYARLNPGVAPEASQQETLSLARRLRELRPEAAQPGEYLEARPILQFDHNSNEFQMALTAAAVVLVLLVAACANLGILVLARGVARQREIRTRIALGAGRPRVVRQLVTESMLLAAISAVCALVLSSGLMAVIRLQSDTGRPFSVVPGWLALAATAGTAMAAALIFGLPPALRVTSAAPGGGSTRSLFLGAQVAASSLLLVVAGLLVSGMYRVRHANAGFDYRHVLWIDPGLKAHGYQGAAAQAYLDDLRHRAAALPGVRATSVAWLAPWGNRHSSTGWAGRQFVNNHVDPDFLKTMGLRLLAGRGFLPGEQHVAIVTDSVARMLWPDSPATGQRLPWSPSGPTVIGVVADASTGSIGMARPLEFYVPVSVAEAPESVLLLRFDGSPQDAARRLQEAARSIDPRLQPSIETLESDFDREFDRMGRALALLTLLGSIAVALSAIGLGGLAGYTVARRTREFGVRMALGARSGHLILAILSPMFVPVAAGFLCGAFGGGAVVRILSEGISALSGHTAFDLPAYFAALLFFLGVIALAVCGPARRAIRINPGAALQHE